MPDNGIEPTETTIGEELKRLREARGISLKEIADSTKIGKRFLEAVEQSDWKTLPAAVFTRGFIRAYARYVGADDEAALERYNAILETERVAELEGEPGPLPQHRAPAIEPRPREIPRPYRRIDRNLILLVLILVPLIAVAYWVRQRAGSRPASPAAPQVAADVAEVPAHGPVPAPPAEATGPVSGLRMTIRANETSWLVIQVDGKPFFSDEMRAGDVKTIHATDRIEFKTIGNAGGVSITLNGKELGPLGESGRVIHDKVFYRDSVETTTP
jgi:Uncharacterized protein conserved in bacteria